MNDIQIIPMLESDLPTLMHWAEDEKTLLQWCGPVFEYPLTVEQLQKYFSETTGPNPSRYIYKAVIDSNNMVGICELGAVNQKNETGSLCRIFVEKSFRGRGIAELMISIVLEFGFKELHLTRIELNVYTYNNPAYKCYEKLGFIREGLKRKVTKYNNEYWDGYVYGLLKDDWEKLRSQA